MGSFHRCREYLCSEWAVTYIAPLPFTYYNLQTAILTNLYDKISALQYEGLCALETIYRKERQTEIAFHRK